MGISRNYCYFTTIYVKHLPEHWLTILRESNLSLIVSNLNHDRDGDFESHYHVLFFPDNLEGVSLFNNIFKHIFHCTHIEYITGYTNVYFTMHYMWNHIHEVCYPHIYDDEIIEFGDISCINLYNFLEENDELHV